MSEKPSTDLAVPRLGQDLLQRSGSTVVDLTRDIFQGMPLWPGHQLPFVVTNQTHEGYKRRWHTDFGFEAHNWLISEHTGTHTDAIFEYDPTGATLDTMPLEYYYGSAIALDVSHVRHPDYITSAALIEAEEESTQKIGRGDIVLLYTGHGDRTYPTEEFVSTYAGLSEDGARWLAEKGVVNIGIDTLSIDHTDDVTYSGHRVCGEYQIANTENLTNLDRLVGKRFQYYGLPLRLRGGTGSPIRAVALLGQ
jgi:kynurenine formamidase